jgi:hypothetical protein
MANSEPHPLDPDSKLNPEERVLFTAIHGDADDAWAWSSATVATTTVTQLHAIGAHVCVGRDCPHDTHRDPLPSEARARSGDPQTSKQAALTIDNMTDRQYAVLKVAETFILGPFTYDELIHRYGIRREGSLKPFDLPHQEPSSIRSRAAELRRAGFIVEAGRGMSDAGRPCNLWTVA